MAWSSELILLAPKVLSKRKPLEHPSFIGLFTGLTGEYSEGFIYLIYSFKNIEEQKDIEGWLVCESTYYDDKNIYIQGIKYTIFILKTKDSQDLESCKKYGNMFFNTDDWINLFVFWGDLGKDIRSIVNIPIESCLKVFDKEKGLDNSSPLTFNPPIRSTFYNNFFYFVYLVVPIDF